MVDEAVRICLDILPARIYKAVYPALLDGDTRWEEFRLRAGRGFFAQSRNKEIQIPGIGISREDLYSVLERATMASYQSAAEQLRRGFYTIPGGHRIGVSGRTVRRGDSTLAYQELSSLNIRVARQVFHAAGQIEGELLDNQAFPGTLIISPPGCGKTTLLREIVRLLSDRYGIRVGLADERGEVAAMNQGVPQFEIGLHTDVMDGCEKAEGALMLLRSMNPQVIAVDELTAPEDARAITAAANCGVAVLATAHASSLDELLRRPVYVPLLQQKIFSRVIRIFLDHQGERKLSVENLTC